jgi:hypothetical protein
MSLFLSIPRERVTVIGDGIKEKQKGFVKKAGLLSGLKFGIARIWLFR